MQVQGKIRNTAGCPFACHSGFLCLQMKQKLDAEGYLIVFISFLVFRTESLGWTASEEKGRRQNPGI